MHAVAHDTALFLPRQVGRGINWGSQGGVFVTRSPAGSRTICSPLAAARDLLGDSRACDDRQG